MMHLRESHFSACTEKIQLHLTFETKKQKKSRAATVQLQETVVRRHVPFPAPLSEPTPKRSCWQGCFSPSYEVSI